MKKLSNAEADLRKKTLITKKACISLVPLMKAYLNYFLFRREIEVAFAWIAWIGFSRPHFADLKLWFKDWPL